MTKSTFQKFARKFILFFIVSLFFSTGMYGMARAQQNNEFTVLKYICPPGPIAPADVAAECVTDTLGINAQLYPDGVPLGTQFPYAVRITNTNGHSEFKIEDYTPDGFNLVGSSIECLRGPIGSSTANGVPLTFPVVSVALPDPVSSASPVAINLGEEMWCVFSGFFDSRAISAENNIVVTDLQDHQNADKIEVSIDNATVLPVDLVVDKQVDIQPPSIVDVSNGSATVEYTVTITNNGGLNGDIDVYLGDFLTVTDNMTLPAQGAPISATLVDFQCENSGTGGVGGDCLETPAVSTSATPNPAAEFQVISSFTPTRLFFASFAPGVDGFLAAGETITLTYTVEVEGILDCLIAPGADGLNNEITMGFNSTAGITMSDSNASNNTSTSEILIETGSTNITPDCAISETPPELAVTKELLFPSPASNVLPWNGVAVYSILIENITDHPITDIRVRDKMRQLLGTPNFASIFDTVSWSCTVDPTIPGNSCGTVAGSGSNAFGSTDYIQEFGFYGDSKYIWGAPAAGSGGTDNATLVSLATGEKVVIEFRVQFKVLSCDSMTALQNNLIRNQALVAYDRQLLDEFGDPLFDANHDPITEVIVVPPASDPPASVDVKMGEIDACEFKVTKKVDSAGLQKVEFGTPINYGVTFSNTSNSAVVVGSVIDALRLVDNDYADQLNIDYKYKCSPAFGSEIAPVNYSGPLPWSVNVGWTSTTTGYASVPSQGTRIIDLGPLKFAANSTLECSVTVEVSRPSVTNQYCKGAGIPRLENTALMDISSNYFGNVWVPAGASTSYVSPQPLGTSQPASQSENWASVALELPKCYSLLLNKNAELPFTWVDGPAIDFIVGVENNGDDMLDGGPGAPWEGPVLTDGDITSGNVIAGLTVTSGSSPTSPEITPAYQSGLPIWEWIDASGVIYGPNTPPFVPFTMGIGKLQPNAPGNTLEVKYKVEGQFTAGDVVCNQAKVTLEVDNLDTQWYPRLLQSASNPTPGAEESCVLVLPTGDLVVKKIVQNNTAAPLPPFDFSIGYVCNDLVDNSQTPPVYQAVTGSVDLHVGSVPANGAAGSPHATTAIPVLGSQSCTVTENTPLPTLDDLDPSKYCPANQEPAWTGLMNNLANPVAIVAGQPVGWSVTNTVTCVPQRGKLKIKKAFGLTPAGPGSPGPIDYSAVDFEVSINGCHSDPPSSVHLNAAGGFEADVTVQAGEVCTISETLPPNPDPLPAGCIWSASYTPGASAMMTAGQNVMTVTNTAACKIPATTLTIVKQFEPGPDLPSPSALANANFPFTISGLGCNPSSSGVTLNAANTPQPWSQSVLVSAGGVCQVNESPPTNLSPPLPVNCHWDVTYSPTNSILTAAGANEIVVTNKVVCEPVPPVSLDHYQCYNIKQLEPFEPKYLQLEDQFGLTENVAVRPIALCAPVDKNFDKGFEGMINEIDHLVCYELQEKIPVNRLVEIDNQFGIQKMRVLDTQVLCVPSEKRLLDEPPAKNPVLEIKKEAKTKSCVAGAPCEFVITISNSGNGDFNGPLWISDQTSPSGLNIDPVSPPLGCSGNLLCETNSLSLPANGGFETFTVSVDVPAGFTGKGLENCVTLQDTAQGGPLDDDCAEVPIEPALPEIDFSIVKSRHDFELGGGVVYRGYKITVTNLGDAVNVPPGNIVVTDTVPVGLSLQVIPSPDWSCAPTVMTGLGTIACQWIGTGTIVHNQQLTGIVFQGLSSSAEPVKNCASLSVDDGLGNLFDYGPACADVASDLSLTKTLINGPLSVGDIAQFEIGGHFDGTTWLVPTVSGALTIVDDLPAGFVFSGVTNGTSSYWDCLTLASGQQVTCTYIGGYVLPGVLPPITLEATATAAGSFENCATISILNSGPDSNPLNDHACAEFEVSKIDAKIDFSIAKTFKFTPGAQAEFVIQVSNEGDTLSAPASISVEELLPAGMMAQLSSATSPNWSCTPGVISGPANISCQWQGPFPVGPGLMPVIRFESVLTAAMPMKNCASVAISGGQTDVALGNNGPSCPEVYADISVVKTAQFAGVLNVGDHADFALKINVSSEFQILNQPPNLLTIDDVLPAGLAFAGIVPNAMWTCSASGQHVQCVLTGAGGTIGGNGIGPGGDFANLLIIKTIATAPVNAKNCAVISKSGGGADSVPGNNESCASVRVKDKTIKVDLGVKKRLISKTPVFVGDIAAFELNAMNFSNVLISTSAPNQLRVTDTLPSGFDFVAATNSPPWNCTGSGRNVSCLWVGPPSTVVPGPLAAITVKALVKDDSGLLNCPEILISGQYVDTNGSNNGSCIKVDVRYKPKSRVDLGIKKRPLKKGPLVPGSVAKFRIDINNHGTPFAAPPAFQIKVKDILPPGFVYLGASTNGQWACPKGSSSGSVDCVWTGGQAVPTGQLGWIKIAMKVPKGPATLRQCAKVRISGQTDVHPKDNGICIPVRIAKKKGGESTGGSSGPSTPTLDKFACVSGLRSANSSLNMRIAPSGNAAVRQKLLMGTALKILVRKGKWSQVQVAANGERGARGWVASRFTKDAETPAQCKKSDVGITTGGGAATGSGSTGGGQSTATRFLCVAGLPKGDNVLNLRGAPKASSKLISKLPAGNVLLFMAKRGGWTRVQVFNNGRKGPQGWVSSRFTKEVKNPATCRRFIKTPVRTGGKPKVDLGKVPLVDPAKPPKAPVIPLGTPDKPAKVPASPQKLACIGGKTRPGQTTGMFSAPASSSKQIAKLKNGEILRVTTSKAGWVLVRSGKGGNGPRGWVSLGFVQFVSSEGECRKFIK